jgi:hypothetical protein
MVSCVRGNVLYIVTFTVILKSSLSLCDPRPSGVAEPEIQNENLFESLGRQIERWTTRWRRQNGSDAER